MRKKLLALLLAAALALGLLAGCGGESVASALLKLLDGRYPNISVEMDPDLEAELRRAIRKAEAENAGDDAAVIRAALETALGSDVTFRYLGDGQKGETAFDLVFYAGSDPDKAAQAAYSQWNLVFSNVPGDGQYDTSLAMVETNSGVWMLVKATVEKAGTVDKPDTDDDEPETQEPEEQEKGYTEEKDSDGNVTGYTVNTKDGLQKLYDDLKDTGGSFASAKITLNSSVTLDANWKGEEISFSGTLNGNGNKITMKDDRSQGLFNEIGTGGTVQDVDIEVSGTINDGGSGNVGAVAGENNGTIDHCDVTISSRISGSDNYNTGGVAGWNNGGTIQNCRVTGTGTIEIISYNNSCCGGIAGLNSNIIQGCSVSVKLHKGSYTGGVAGGNSGTVIACHSTSAISDANVIGGVVGSNSGTVTACYHAVGEVSGGINNGGVVGYNYIDNDSDGSVTACYWSGSPEKGIDSGNQAGEYGKDSTYKINGDQKTTWDMAVNDNSIGMNAAITANDPDFPYKWVANGDGLPTLTNQ